MIKKVILVFTITSYLFLPAEPVFACKCDPPPTASAAESADAVFSGKAIKIEYLDPPKQHNPEPRIVVTFNVYRSWKGLLGKTFILHTVYNSWSCDGYYFREGLEYLVFAQREKLGTSNKATAPAIPKGTFGTTLCSGTQMLKDAQEDLTILGNGKIPE